MFLHVPRQNRQFLQTEQIKQIKQISKFVAKTKTVEISKIFKKDTLLPYLFCRIGNHIRNMYTDVCGTYIKNPS